jgi:hypothetical protein
MVSHLNLCNRFPVFVCPAEIHTGKIRQFSYVQLTALNIYSASSLTPVTLDVSGLGALNHAKCGKMHKKFVLFAA